MTAGLGFQYPIVVGDERLVWFAARLTLWVTQFFSPAFLFGFAGRSWPID